MRPEELGESWFWSSYLVSLRPSARVPLLIGSSGAQDPHFKEQTVGFHFVLEPGKSRGVEPTRLIGQLVQHMIEAIQCLGERRVAVLLGILTADAIRSHETPRLVAKWRNHLLTVHIGVLQLDKKPFRAVQMVAQDDNDNPLRRLWGNRRLYLWRNACSACSSDSLLLVLPKPASVEGTGNRSEEH